MRKFKQGQRVILPANKKEGWPEERGVIFRVENQRQYPGMYLVEVLTCFNWDDGLREVHADDIRPESK